MALEAYILVKGFDGTSKKAGHPQKSSIVHSVSHEVMTPVDTESGQLSRRQHRPIKVKLPIDASIYQYQQAHIAKDGAGYKKLDVELGFFRSDQSNIGLEGSGEQAPYFKIQLKDALVVGVAFTMDDTRAAEAGQPSVRTEYIEVTFVYRQIHWVYTKGNKETMDDLTSQSH